MATFHENLVQSFKNFRDKYLKANGVVFQFSYDSTTGKFGYKDANGNFVPFRRVQASKTVSPSTSSQTVTPDSGYDGIASVTVNAVNLQSKTVSPSTSSQTVTPDSGYDGIASVTVNAVNLQSKTTTMTPPSPSSWSATTTKLGTVTPDSGYTGLSQVDISIPMIPDNTTLTLQNSGTSYDTYTTGRGGYIFSNSYLRVPKGGELSETTLWTNPDATATFTPKTVTLNQSISNFKYIKIYTDVSTSEGTDCICMMKTSEFLNTGQGGKNTPKGAFSTTGRDGTLYFRPFFYNGNTSQVQFGNAITWSGTTTNTALIPERIVGLN